MAKTGREFVFHGSFKSKRAAIRKERQVKGFILKRKGRYVVVTRRFL